jgi:hypothetical protein
VLLAGLLLCATVAHTRAASTPTWRLVDYHQSICFDSHATSNYYGIWIKGRWTHSIGVGIAQLPAGGAY